MSRIHTLDFRLPDLLPARLPVIPLRRGVLLPGTLQRFGVGRDISRAAIAAAKDDWVLVAVQREPVADPMPSDLLPIATVARIVERQDGAVVLQGLSRASLTGFPSSRPFLEASYERRQGRWPGSPNAVALERTLREAATETAEVAGLPEGLKKQLQRLPIDLLVDAAAAQIDAPEAWRRDFLQTLDPLARGERLLTQLAEFKAVVEAQRSIKERVKRSSRDLQKEHVLRQQLKAIHEELGEGDEGSELDRLRIRLDETPLPETVRDTVDRELRRLERINPGSPERAVAVDWLEWIADMPWETPSSVQVDLDTLEEALERSHHGLDDVKRQVVEHLAVRKLSGSGRADVLLLVGPPGVGKTSIGQAIADATGRKLVRVALGGVRDEAELRGHRRTYIGARPGRLVEGLRRAGTSDPVILLDEIDKLGRGMQGDPGAALLEILDPEQNHAFTDHYLEVPFDLSGALFVATANDLSTIPGPLRDRLEILNIDGYSRREKRTIARDHLLTKLAENAGLSVDDVELSDDAIDAAIAGWTREAGVRQLQRVLGRVYRAAAVEKARGRLDGPLVVDAEDLETYLKRRPFVDRLYQRPDRPGFATGLAWTPAGGDVLSIEASDMPGTGRLVLTGQLGDVMKESARAALTWVLSNHQALGIDAEVLAGRDLHVHVPAGAVPKDGPSAGVTMVTAIASRLSGRPVLSGLAMTGETSLGGDVLPVGGIKAKVLAAHRRGLATVLLPKHNERDLEDLPDEVRHALDIHVVSHLDEVLMHAFGAEELAAAS